MSFGGRGRGGGRGGGRGRGGARGGGRGGGRGGFGRSWVEEIPDRVEVLGKVLHTCQDELVCLSSNKKVSIKNEISL